MIKTFFKPIKYSDFTFIYEFYKQGIPYDLRWFFNANSNFKINSVLTHTNHVFVTISEAEFSLIT